MTLPLTGLLLLLAACGDGDGNDDTLLTGFSGFLIVCLVVGIVIHFVRKR